MSIETDVMDAAAALKLAVDRAKAAGYHINWPLRASDIGSIAVSETGKVAGHAEATLDAEGDRDGLAVIEAKPRYRKPIVTLADEDIITDPVASPDESET